MGKDNEPGIAAAGAIVPQGMGSHLSPKATPMDQFVREELVRRAAYDARPDVIQKRAEDAAADERMRLAKLAARGKGEGLIGPPNPRKGRLPMTR